MYFDYLNALVFAAVGFVFVFANLIVASILRPKRKTDVGLETYECGEETIGDAWIQFDIRYYTVALVYVIFAVEIAFLFPWALVLRDCFLERGACGCRRSSPSTAHARPRTSRRSGCDCARRWSPTPAKLPTTRSYPKVATPPRRLTSWAGPTC